MNEDGSSSQFVQVHVPGGFEPIWMVLVYANDETNELRVQEATIVSPSDFTLTTERKARLLQMMITGLEAEDIWNAGGDES
jgi:hypothetical protein